MIGVLANDADHPAVREFFELFKTPWEFYRHDRRYDVLICSDDRFPRNDCRLVLVFGAGERAVDGEKGIKITSRRPSALLSYKGDKIPIYGGCVTFTGPGADVLTDDGTRHAAASKILSEGQTLVRIGFDLFKEVRHLLANGQPVLHAGIPALELHIGLVRDLITGCSIDLVEIPPVPAGHAFMACLTHDVDHVGVRNHKCDHTMFGFLYRAIIGSLINVGRGRMTAGQAAANWAAALSLPLVHLGLVRDFWYQFERYAEMEKGLGSTFFLIPYPDDPGQDASGGRPARRAASYDVAAIADHLRGLLSAGHEIGLHGIDAWRDSAKGREEGARISGITGAAELGVRMHWLFFDHQSPATLERAGFSYDSTVGYNEAVGYRAGTTQAFKPLGLDRMLELPMHLMDTALFYKDRMDLSPKEAGRAVARLVENAVRFGGALTVNWHDRSLAPERLWGDFYVRLLDDLKRKGAWFPTASQAVAWFRKRRSAVIEDLSHEGGGVRIKASVNADDGLPGLRVRVHRATAPRVGGAAKSSSAGGFVDLAFDRGIDLLIEESATSGETEVLKR